MAEEDLTQDGGKEGQEEKEPKKKGGMMKIIIILVAVVLLGAGGFFGWKFFMADSEEPAAETAQTGEKKAAEGEKGAAKEEGAEKEEGEGKAPAKPGTVLNLEPFIVNLADPSGKRYLKLTLTVDAKDEKLKKEMEDRMPMIRDSLLLLLTSKSYADINSVAGKLRLRNEVLKAINRSLGGVGAVHAVYFTEFVVQ
ncbi:MAG: flagellar basal body-associated FliL family protein [Desulfarculaceae bacterium]|jgi:flagellar FliL protein